MANAIVQRNAFVFCRYSVAALIWIALLARSVYVLVAVFLILAASAALTVRNAPMIRLYQATAGRFIRSPEVVLDVSAMRFAHTLGAVLAAVSIALVLLESPAAVPFVFLFAVLKTTSALGFCPAYKLYGCALKGGGCCGVLGKR